MGVCVGEVANVTQYNSRRGLVEGGVCTLDRRPLSGNITCEGGSLVTPMPKDERCALLLESCLPPWTSLLNYYGLHAF